MCAIILSLCVIGPSCILVKHSPTELQTQVNLLCLCGEKKDWCLYSEKKLGFSFLGRLSSITNIFLWQEGDKHMRFSNYNCVAAHTCVGSTVLITAMPSNTKEKTGPEVWSLWFLSQSTHIPSPWRSHSALSRNEETKWPDEVWALLKLMALVVVLAPAVKTTGGRGQNVSGRRGSHG